MTHQAEELSRLQKHLAMTYYVGKKWRVLDSIGELCVFFLTRVSARHNLTSVHGAESLIEIDVVYPP